MRRSFLLLSLFWVVSSFAFANDPLKDAVGVWHFSDRSNSADPSAPLTVHGDVRLGVTLSDGEIAESKRRGGDGQVADFSAGGWLDAGLGTDDRLRIGGQELTCYLRVRDLSGTGSILSRSRVENPASSSEATDPEETPIHLFYNPQV